MACPYFYPVEACAGSALLPLGDWWKGLCRALPGTPQADAVDAVAGNDAGCNLGYARGQCARFPDDDGPDAVRFTVSSHESTAIRISYVLERDHHPFAHGRLEYSTAAAAFVAPPESVALERQARAYLESYLRRKEET